MCLKNSTGHRIEFEAYLAVWLRDPVNRDLRRRFLKKMSDIAREA